MRRIAWDLADYAGWVSVGYFLLILSSACEEPNVVLLVWGLAMALIVIAKNRSAGLRTTSLELLGVYAGTAATAAFLTILFGSPEPTLRQGLIAAGIVLFGGATYAAGRCASRHPALR